MEYYIGIDLGTTAIKAVLFDGSGRSVRQVSREIELFSTPDGGLEQEASCWYELPCRLIGELCTGLPSGSVKGIGVSSQGITILPVGRDGTPLGRGISWLDTRAEEECREIGEAIPEQTLFGDHGAAFVLLLYPPEAAVDEKAPPCAV